MKPKQQLSKILETNVMKHCVPQVYLVKCGDYIKIGYTTRSLASRFSGSNTENPYDRKLLFTIITPHAKVLEQRLHDAFSKKRHRNEWFKLSEQDILDIWDAIDIIMYGETD